MFHAIFLITLGSLLLAINFGVLTWSIWSNLISYWPTLIIFVGIDILLGHSHVGRFVSGLISTIIFLAIVARVVGFNYQFLNLIPLPKKNAPMELFFTNKDGIDQGFYYFNGRKGTF